MHHFAAYSRLRICLVIAFACLPCLAARTKVCAQSSADTSHLEPATKRPWLNSQLQINERVQLLVRSMTLQEKIGQLWQVSGVSAEAMKTDDGRAAYDALIGDIRSGQVGSIINEIDTQTINSLQKVAVEESRLGVPLIVGRDVIHGFRTIFPIPLGQAASWNPELVEKAAAIAAGEARSVGIHWTFAPMVDIARDPRWGRIAESLGEDPYLASKFATAMVRGFQGEDLSAHDRVAACAKHFAGYGAGEGGRDYNSAILSPSSLRNVYLPPFHAAVQAGVATLMTAFNDLNGIPGSANTYLLQDVLRKEWKFQGFVVSDWESVREMIVHGYCQDEKDAAHAAARAGVSMEMVSRTYHDHLAALVESKEIPQSTVDRLVTEVLRVKMQLGLFESPYAEPSDAKLLTKNNLELARQLATQSVVLLKNEQGLLPLDKSQAMKVAIIGPLADDKQAQLGAWSLDGHPDDSRTPLSAIRDSAGFNTEMVFASGLSNSLDSSKQGFEEAMAVARNADVVLLFVGEGADLSGEAHSRAILDLPGAQNDLIDAIASTGKPIVLVIQAGRPLTIGLQLEKVASALYSFHAGTMAGPAIADLVWGAESPSAKLPATFPKSVGQIPLYYNHTNTGRPPREYDFARDKQFSTTIKQDLGNNSNYIDIGPYPLFPFGYGLSYTSFEYGNVELSSTELRADQPLTIKVPLKNTGPVAASEVVQLYIHQLTAHLVQPVRELKGFRRVPLKPNESTIVEFSISQDDVAYFDNEGQRTFEAGKFELYVGSNSLAPLAGSCQVAK